MTCAKQLVLQQKLNQIILRQEIKQVVICGNSVVANILPFTTAPSTSENQTTFTMLGPTGAPISFSQIICLFLMGVGQNPLGTPAPDYTVSGNQITFAGGVGAVGYVVYGAGQI